MEREILFLPKIRKSDYETFRGIMKDNIPNTFDGWLQLVAKWESNYSEKIIRHVQSHPDKFISFTSQSGRPCDMNQLLIFAENIGKGKM